MFSLPFQLIHHADKRLDYPDLEGDEARRRIWLVDVPLTSTHSLRNAVNNGAPVPHELLERYDIPVVASVLKLYLLELPGISPLSQNSFVSYFPNLHRFSHLLPCL